MTFPLRYTEKCAFAIVVAAIILSTFALLMTSGKNALASSNKGHGLAFSDMYVKITSKGRTATFRLYDTAAAQEFYDQLPLELALSNFRDAQWMFYPPEKLNVTPREAYHNGRKGELSYYEPWGDVFMLYEDFHAGDKMHRLGIGLTGIEEISSMSGSVLIVKNHPPASSEKTAMRIHVIANGHTTVFKLNDSPAARDLYAQLPLNISVEDYGGIEKIFYPQEKLDTSDTPLANARPGTLAYYAPWGNVVMFYGSFGPAKGLYELGQAISGSDFIQNMSGTIDIVKNGI